MEVIRWLTRNNAFSGLVGAVLVAIVVPATVYFTGYWRSDLTTYTLCIKVPHALAQMPFTVRHVRDGTGEPPPGGLSYKIDLKFPPPQSDGQTCQTLSFPRHVGVMFKVYVTYTGMEFDSVKGILEGAGYTNVSLDSRPGFDNAWFIIPGYIAITHHVSALKGEVIDNFYLD